jgi:hypothetical protein
MAKELKANGVVAFKNSHPEEYAKLIKEGILKEGLSDVNESLAEKILAKDIKGSIDTMSGALTEGSLRSEAKIRAITANAKDPITTPNYKNLVSTLKDISSDYKGIGDGSVEKRALAFAQSLSKGKGKLSAPDTLLLKRFLDGARTKASLSGMTPFARLSTGQQNLKYWADVARKGIRGISKEAEAVMDNYSTYIQGFESIAKEAAKRGNGEFLNSLDTILFGGGWALGEPLAGAALGVAKKTIVSPAIMTNVASSISKGGASTPALAATRAAATSGLTSQQ